MEKETNTTTMTERPHTTGTVSNEAQYVFTGGTMSHKKEPVTFQKETPGTKQAFRDWGLR